VGDLMGTTCNCVRHCNCPRPEMGLFAKESHFSCLHVATNAASPIELLLRSRRMSLGHVDKSPTCRINHETHRHCASKGKINTSSHDVLTQRINTYVVR
jgi:hypothetical protein